MKKVSCFLKKKLNIKLVKKFKKLKYSNDKKLLKLIDLAENIIKKFNKNNEKIIPVRWDYVEKRKIDRSTVFSIDGPFQLMHANLEILGKSAAAPKYALLAVDLYSSKFSVYPMRLRKQLLKYMTALYVEIDKKWKKASNMRLQTDNEFH